MMLLSKQIREDWIACLQEPSITSKGITQLPREYEAFWSTKEGAKPRTTVIVPKRLGGYLVTQHSNRDCTTIRLQSRNITFISLYCDGLEDVKDAWRMPELELLTSRNVIICSDVNATHQSWGGGARHSKNATRGIECSEKMEELNLHICNTRNAPPTYEGPSGRRSHIDVSCCTEAMIDKVQAWRVMREDLGSDHRGIRFEVGGGKMIGRGRENNPISTPWKKPTKQALQMMVKMLPIKVKRHRRIRTAEDVQKFWREHSQEIRQALKDIFPPRKNRRRSECYWWTEEVRIAYSEYQAARRRLRRAAGREGGATRLQEEETKIRRGQWRYQIKIAKTRSWVEFTTSIEDPWAGIHKLVRATDRGRGTTATLCDMQGNYGEDIVCTLQMLATQFFPPLPPCDGKHHRMEAKVEQQLRERGNEGSLEIGQLEYRKALGDMKTSSAPGEDGITTNVIRILSAAGWEKQYRQLFSGSLKWATIPDEWKRAQIVLIPKSGANQSSTKSVRPISLTSVYSKLMERIINQRLTHELEHAGKMKGNQHAYKKGRSTLTALHEAIGYIEKALSRGWICQGVFLDISGAFDRAWHLGILHELLALGASRPLVRWIRSYLENRIATMQAAGEKHAVPLKQGCPQGGVLSPLLWNVLFNRLLTIQETSTPAGSPPIKIIGYADDALVLCQAKTSASATRRLQKYLDKIRSWAEDYRVVFNPSKMCTIVFSRRQAAGSAGTNSGLTFKGIDIKRVEYYKYLGIILDEKLKWTAQIAACQAKLGNITRMFRGCVRERWGIKQHILRLLYEAIFKPIMTYGLSVWASGAQTKQTQKKFDRLIRNYMLMATRTFRSSSQEVLLQIMGVKPFKEAMEEELMRVSILQLRQTGVGEETRQVSVRMKHQHTLQESWKHLDARIHQIKHANLAQHHALHPSYWYQIPVRYDDRIASLWSAANVAGWTCYTDASSTSYGKGWGVALYRHGFLITTRRGSMREASVFTTELHAILQATQLIRETCLAGKEEIEIRTDSLACVRALESCTQVDPNLRMCWLSFREGMKEGLRMILRWTPGHEGVEGNAFADQIAKRAVDSRNTTSMYLVARDARRLMKQKLDKMEQQRFNNVTSFYFRALIPTQEALITYRKENRSAELNQLITGHCRINHFMAKIGVTMTTECSCGEGDETIRHFLCTCKDYEDERAVTWGKPTITWEEAMTSTWERIEEYLKITGRLSRVDQQAGRETNTQTSRETVRTEL